MDTITACATMEEGINFLKSLSKQTTEGAEPESDQYMIGADGDGGNNDYFHVNEGKVTMVITEGQGKMLQLLEKGVELNEEKIGNINFKKYFKPIVKFMEEDGLHVKPYPKVKLDWSEQDGLFIKTGYYEPESKTITIFCDDRHPKDILRTFCHEMIHHSQNLDGVDLNFSSNDDVKDNEKLEEVEAEAYLKGNVYFRKWTEFAKKDSQDVLQEGKEPRKNDKGETVPEKCDKCGGDVVCQIHGEPVFVCKDCGKYFGTMPCNLDEAFISEETDPEDIDLSSFNIKTELNPKFWKDGRLDSRIRMKLLDIADDFLEFLGVNWVEPDDIIMTGSLANYNWNKKFSDIDLHVLIDYSKVDKRTDFVKNYFNSQKQLWNDEHKDLTIYGFNVELYVQDTNEKHSSTGVYSLDKDKWILKPERSKLKNTKINKDLIKKKVSEYVNRVDELEDNFNDADGDYSLGKVTEKAEKLFDDIKAERKSGLGKSDNEISNGNIIYKCLRRLGCIDKIFDIKGKAYDKLNSLSEGKSLLKEDQEGDSMKKAKKYLVSVQNFSEVEANMFVMTKVREEFSALHHNRRAGKFILGLVRLLLEEQLTPKTKVKINWIIENIVSSDELYNSFDKNLNGMTSWELIRQFKELVTKNNDQRKAELKDRLNKQKTVRGNGYTIVRIDSFNEATNYSKYTDYGDNSGHWCITHMKNMYNSYTHGGSSQIYFCLKDGFEKVPRVIGEDCPLDDFGLSMISVIVGPDGRLEASTCRWNHLNGGNDGILNEQQLEEILGVKFGETFLPKNSEDTELDAMIEKFKQTGDKSGFEIYKCIGLPGISIIKAADDKYNLLYNGEIVFDGWLSWIAETSGFILVSRNNLVNLLNKNLKPLSKVWFQSCRATGTFGKLIVQATNDKYNIIVGDEGKLMYDKWLDNIDLYREGFAVVTLNGKQNYIDKSGDFLLDKWVMHASRFRYGYGVISNNGMSNYVDSDGKLFSDHWFKSCSPIDSNGLAVVMYDYTDLRGDTWDYCVAFDIYNRKQLNTTTKYMFSDIRDIGGGNHLLGVQSLINDEKEMWNIFDTYTQEVILPMWVDELDGDFNNEGFIVIRKDGRENAVFRNGEILFDDWYDDLRFIGRDAHGPLVEVMVFSDGVYSSQYRNVISVTKDGYKPLLPVFCRYVDVKIRGDDTFIIAGYEVEENEMKQNVFLNGKQILPFWPDTINYLYNDSIVFDLWNEERGDWKVYSYFPKENIVCGGDSGRLPVNMGGLPSIEQFMEENNLEPQYPIQQ